MMCLEMARALQRRGQEPAAGEPLPVPADLGVLVTERLHGLTGPTRDLLLVDGRPGPTDGGRRDRRGRRARTRRPRALAEAVAGRHRSSSTASGSASPTR